MKITKALVSEHSLARTKFLATGKTLGNKTHVFCPVILCLAARRISCRQIKVTELSKIISDHSRLQVARRLARKHSHHFFEEFPMPFSQYFCPTRGNATWLSYVVNAQPWCVFLELKPTLIVRRSVSRPQAPALTNGSCLGSSL